MNPQNFNSNLEIINWILTSVIEGISPLLSPEAEANKYLNDSSYANNDERVSAVINLYSTGSFCSGFITGLGETWTLPFTIPTSLAASCILQARLAVIIAVIYGHDLKDDKVKTLVALSMIGDSAKEVLKQSGVRLSSKLTTNLIAQIPSQLLMEINKRVGFHLISRTGNNVLISLMKIVPLAGGIVTGSFDAFSCQIVGNTAKNIFKQ